MDISFFERMRVYSGDGGRVIFKLRLPKLDGAREFDRFYISLANAYAAAAERRGTSAVGDVRFNVSFTVDVGSSDARKGKRGKRKKHKSRGVCRALIKRQCVIKSADGEESYSSIDVYNEELDVFEK